MSEGVGDSERSTQARRGLARNNEGGEASTRRHIAHRDGAGSCTLLLAGAMLQLALTLATSNGCKPSAVLSIN